MKIGVHVQTLTDPSLNGIGYYLFHLLEELAKFEEDEYLLISSRELAHSPKGSNIKLMPSSARAPKKCLSYFGFPLTVREQNCDLAFLPKEVVPAGMKVPTIITAYDFFFLKVPDEEKKNIPWKARLHCYLAKQLHLKRAVKILAISEDTKNDLVNLCGVDPKRVIVTPLGIDDSFFEMLPLSQVQAVKAKYQINQPYFFNMSSVWWFRKNLARLIQAFAELKKRRSVPHQLVIVGKPSSSLPEMLDIIKKENLEDDVKLLQYIPREDLVALLQGAHALAFPSMHEGFGFPVLEAMAAQCPVLTSFGSALEEVSADAALLVDPYSIESIELGLEKMVDDHFLRESLIQKGLIRAREFTWNRTAKLTLDVFREFRAG